MPEAPSVTVVGVRVHAKPVDGKTATVSVTVPVKPCRAGSAVTDMLEDPGAPALTVTVVGLADTAKSWIVKVTGAEWVRVPLAPFTVTVYTFAALLVQERVEVWEAPKVMLEGVKVHASPDGDTELVSVTVPVNPLTGATVIVEVAAVPTLTLIVVGLAVTEKSGTATLYVTVALCDRVPVMPVTVTVKLPLVDAVQESDEPPEPVTLVGDRVQMIPATGLL